MLDEPWSNQVVLDSLSQPGRGLAEISAVTFLRFAATGALPIMGAASDGETYWMKWPGNPHGVQSLVNEVVVGHLGSTIGAPVRPSRLVFVDEELLEGSEFRSSPGGVRLPSGIYSASLLLDGAEELTAIERVRRDGNSTRLPYFLALWDLCLGDDLQLLYDTREDDQVWSIDHGMWFDSQEGDWDWAYLDRIVGNGWRWPDGGRHPRGVDSAALHGAADAVARLTVSDISDALREVPVEWRVSDQDLCSLGRFVFRRRDGVARRLREAAARHP